MLGGQEHLKRSPSLSGNTGCVWSVTAANLVTAELDWSCAGQGLSSPAVLGQKRRQRFYRQRLCGQLLGCQTALGLVLGRGGVEVLVSPDPADSSARRAYFMLHLISSYKIIVSLCPVEPRSGGADSQPPCRSFCVLDGRGTWRVGEARPGLVPVGPDWPWWSPRGLLSALRLLGRWEQPQGAEKQLRPWVVGGYCTAELLQHRRVTSVMGQSCDPEETRTGCEGRAQQPE